MGLTGIRVRNYRVLADIALETGGVNVLFGPNGSGKSTLLDAVRFVHDCAVQGVDGASSYRNYGVGALWDGANGEAALTITLETGAFVYRVALGYSAGRIVPFAGERLLVRGQTTPLVERRVGSKEAEFYRADGEVVTVSLREPERLAVSRYLEFDEGRHAVAAELDALLRSVSFFYLRQVNLTRLKRFGSESSHHVRLWEDGRNLWSVLRNLHDRRAVDGRYDAIMGFMRRGFPGFRDLLIEQTGPNAVYGSIIEEHHRRPIMASDVSDGYLQALALLTALFSEGRERPSLLLFDEPEISLHPYALAVFAEAVREAVTGWQRQVFIATHSPVLISQFAPEEVLATRVAPDGRAVITRVSEMEEVGDLVAEYAIGSLYMAEMIAPQSRLEGEG